MTLLVFDHKSKRGATLLAWRLPYTFVCIWSAVCLTCARIIGAQVHFSTSQFLSNTAHFAYWLVSFTRQLRVPTPWSMLG